MFPFRKPPTKLELAKKGVSDAAHHLIDAIPAAQIEEKFEDLKKGAALAATAAGVAAHHAGEAAAHKFGELQDAASHLGEGVMSAAHTAQSATQSAATAAAAKASAATHGALESAQNARETLGEKARSVAGFRERAARDLEIGGKEARHAKEVAQKAAEREASAIKARAAAMEAKKQAKLLEKEAEIAQKEANKSASQAKDAALKAAAELKAAQEQAASEQAAEAQAHLEAEAETQAQKARAEAEEAARAEYFSAKAAKKEAKAEAKARAIAEDAEAQAEKARSKAEKAERNIVSERSDGEVDFAEVEIADGSSKVGWIILGLAIGAVLALLFAPTTGRRSRAAIKDRLGKVSDGAVDAATATSDKVGDIAQRVEGLAHQVEAKFASDSAGDDDGTIADRVRSTLGHHDIAKTIERLNIDCAEGVVTLRGPVLDQATQDILVTAVKTIPGVKDVIADFLTDEAPENPAESAI